MVRVRTAKQNPFCGINMRFLLIFTLLFYTQPVLASRVEGKRIKVNHEFLWVGQLFMSGRPVCTAWILQHGLAITAKHCFTHARMSQEFANQNIDQVELFLGEADSPLRLGPKEIKQIHFDSGSNDIAFIFYNARATNKIALPDMHISKTYAPPGLPIMLVGFPRSALGDRILSDLCRTTGLRKDFPPMPRDIGYDGIFEDTTCGASYGVSGGVVFFKENKNVFILGVLTHTFNVLADGSINPQMMFYDNFGDHTSGMYSPLYLSRDLLQLSSL